MDEFLQRLDPYQKEDWKQFRRRCRFYITMKEDYMIVREYDFQSDSYINDTYLENPVKGLIEKTKAEPKMSPEEISMHLGIPLLPNDKNTKKEKMKNACTHPPTAFIVDIPESTDITPPPFWYIVEKWKRLFSSKVNHKITIVFKQTHLRRR